jgi:hypothetical protein
MASSAAAMANCAVMEISTGQRLRLRSSGVDSMRES